MSLPLQTAVKNRILAALPPSEFALIAKHLTHVELALGESLHRAGDVISNVFFVESGFISALTMLSDGQPLEIGLIGAEGVAGISVAVQGKRDQELLRIDARHDGRGNPYYWIAFGRGGIAGAAPGSDLVALNQNRISVTPLRLDLTDEPFMTKLADVFD